MDLIFTTALSSLGASAIIILAAYLSKEWIFVRLTKAIQHEYDDKLAKINSQLRISEAEINSIQKATFENITSGQTALNNRRVQAVDDLWMGINESKKHLLAVQFLAKLNLKEVSKQIHAPNVQQFIDTLVVPMNIDKDQLFGENSKKASSARPWLGDKIWHLYTAYIGIIGYSIMVFVALKNRISEIEKFLDQSSLIDQLQKALPNLDLDWNNLSEASFPILLDLIELHLLQEIELVTSGKQSDEEVKSRIKTVSQDLVSINQQHQD